jgi:VanZ family protein
MIRKSAHVLEYGVLSWLTWRALHRPVRHENRPWSWKTAMTSLGVVILCAATDELHQRFVPNRTGSITDVCIDTAGGVLGLALIWFVYTRRRR